MLEVSIDRRKELDNYTFKIIVLGNGLLHDETEPLNESTLTSHQWESATFIWGQFLKGYLSHWSLK